MRIPHRGGLPHSDTSGSTPARGSPKFFAACHVLLRLLAPRHPPDALLILKTSPHTPKGTWPSLAQDPSSRGQWPGASDQEKTAPRRRPQLPAEPDPITHTHSSSPDPRQTAPLES